MSLEFGKFSGFTPIFVNNAIVVILYHLPGSLLVFRGIRNFHHGYKALFNEAESVSSRVLWSKNGHFCSIGSDTCNMFESRDQRITVASWTVEILHETRLPEKQDEWWGRLEYVAFERLVDDTCWNLWRKTSYHFLTHSNFKVNESDPDILYQHILGRQWPFQVDVT